MRGDSRVEYLQDAWDTMSEETREEIATIVGRAHDKAAMTDETADAAEPEIEKPAPNFSSEVVLAMLKQLAADGAKVTIERDEKGGDSRESWGKDALRDWMLGQRGTIAVSERPGGSAWPALRINMTDETRDSAEPQIDPEDVSGLMAAGAESEDPPVKLGGLGKLVVVEYPDPGGTEWVLSFNGPNPADDECVLVPDGLGGMKLKALVEGLITDELEKGEGFDENNGGCFCLVPDWMPPHWHWHPAGRIRRQPGYWHSHSAEVGVPDERFVPGPTHRGRRFCERDGAELLDGGIARRRWDRGDGDGDE